MANIDQAIDIIISFILIFIMLFYQDYILIEAYTIIFISFLILVSSYNSKHYVLLPAWLFICASKNVDKTKILGYAYWTLIAAIVLIILLYVLGKISDYRLFREGTVRFSLGFSHPNILGFRLFELIAIHFYRYRNRIKLINFVFALATTIFVYIIPNSQTAYICLLVLIVMIFIQYMCNKKWRIIRTLFSQLCIIMCVAANAISVFMTIADVQSNMILYKFSTMMSHRFFYCNLDYRIFGISLLGQPILISGEGVQFKGVPKLYLDNVYAGILLWYGLFVFLCFTLAFLCTVIFFNYYDNYVSAILSVYAIYGVMELGVCYFSYNIFLLMIAMPLFKYTDKYMTMYKSDNYVNREKS